MGSLTVEHPAQAGKSQVAAWLAGRAKPATHARRPESELAPTPERKRIDVNADLEAQRQQPTPADVARATSALMAIPTPGEFQRNAFRDLVFAARAAGVPDDDLRAWAQRERVAYDKGGDAGFQKLLDSDKGPGAGIGAGSLYHAARAAGWSDKLAPRPALPSSEGVALESRQPYRLQSAAEVLTLPPHRLGGEARPSRNWRRCAVRAFRGR